MITRQWDVIGDSPLAFQSVTKSTLCLHNVHQCIAHVIIYTVQVTMLTVGSDTVYTVQVTMSTVGSDTVYSANYNRLTVGSDTVNTVQVTIG